VRMPDLELDLLPLNFFWGDYGSTGRSSIIEPDFPQWPFVS
jgi:hypothetical protein